jgi:hypothetical protein
MEKKLIEHGKLINISYITKHTNYEIDSGNEWKTCCYITKRALLYLFECTSCSKHDSNFITIYIEYKNVGHACCIYDNKLFQSFGNHHYLQITPLHVSVDELLSNIKCYIALLYPLQYIKLNEPENLYVQIKYYSTKVSDDQIISNLNKLCK